MADGGHHEAIGDAVVKFWPVVTGLVLAGWASVRALLKGRDLSDHARGEVITIAQNAATGMIKLLEERGALLQRRVDTLEDEVQELHKGMQIKDTEIALLRGENRQLRALAASYEAKLTAANIPHEKPLQPFWRMDDGVPPTNQFDGVQT